MVSSLVESNQNQNIAKNIIRIITFLELLGNVFSKIERTLIKILQKINLTK